MSVLRNGLWRAQVSAVNTTTGEVRVIQRELFGPAPTSWVPPCFPPVATPAWPNVGQEVWLAFEKGDENHPIWTGISL